MRSLSIFIQDLKHEPLKRLKIYRGKHSPVQEDQRRRELRGRLRWPVHRQEGAEGRTVDHRVSGKYWVVKKPKDEKLAENDKVRRDIGKKLPRRRQGHRRKEPGGFQRVRGVFGQKRSTPSSQVRGGDEETGHLQGEGKTSH